MFCVILAIHTSYSSSNNKVISLLFDLKMLISAQKIRKYSFFHKSLMTEWRRRKKLQSDPGNKCHWHAQIESKAVSIKRKKRKGVHIIFPTLPHQLHKLCSVVCYFFFFSFCLTQLLLFICRAFERKSNGIQWIVMNIMQILFTNVSIFFSFIPFLPPFHFHFFVLSFSFSFIISQKLLVENSLHKALDVNLLERLKKCVSIFISMEWEIVCIALNVSSVYLCIERM